MKSFDLLHGNLQITLSAWAALQVQPAHHREAAQRIFGENVTDMLHGIAQVWILLAQAAAQMQQKSVDMLHGIASIGRLSA